MNLIIGRESGVVAPRLCIKDGNRTKFIGQPGSVPKTVSRNHCRIEKTNDGKLRITNISDQNSVYVNGIDCQSKTIDKNDLVELGTDHYRLDLASVVKVIESVDVPTSYSIIHLKQIWDNYSQAKLDMQIRERKINALSAIPGVISMISIALSFIDGFRAVFISVAAICAMVFAIIRLKGAENGPLKQRELEDGFQDDYVCPNPKCHHFLGNRSYKLVLKDGCCPWCKSKYTE